MSSERTKTLASSSPRRIRSEPVVYPRRSAFSALTRSRQRCDEEALIAFRLAFQHLGHEVVRDDSVGTGELHDGGFGIFSTASESAARRRPATQPSVRAWSVRSASFESVMRISREVRGFPRESPSKLAREAESMRAEAAATGVATAPTQASKDSQNSRSSP